MCVCICVLVCVLICVIIHVLVCVFIYVLICVHTGEAHVWNARVALAAHGVGCPQVWTPYGRRRFF